MQFIDLAVHGCASLGSKKTDFPLSEDCSTRIFSIPMHPYLKSEDQERIAIDFQIIDKVIK